MRSVPTTAAATRRLGPDCTKKSAEELGTVAGFISESLAGFNRNPQIIGIDDTIERRWGPKIAARGIYRDPVRSSKGHFVKTSGLRWLVLAVMLPVA